MRLLMPQNASATTLLVPPTLLARPKLATVDKSSVVPLLPEGISFAKGACWIYSLSYGGGLVNGDDVSVVGSVDDYCTAVLATQASTKVYGPHRLPINQPSAEEVRRTPTHSNVL